ncbi:hypothetical protein EIN_063510 [Entamoeba invadens IP1]|uniref:hypothetical protein n=1 Tax=Entamoeba invadens IP1 TaxID=370355 RepID=UPI0002C3E5A3|nr:hypothetical protein EIN_063510 [Entamoeba invadens IP1]ELP93606.1 hypothetical protein EIN_063510 [Entamoeba invadens IP1]|eukprot:XP_004260377.1 hypothetical protein EIN_063510 [Entamoeba invadens IP1]
MKLIILLLFATTIVGWGEINNVIRPIYLETSDEWTIETYNENVFTFNYNCCTYQEKGYNDTNLTENDVSVSREWKFFGIINMKHFFLMTRPEKEKVTIYEDDRPEGLVITFGCFDGSTGCRQTQTLRTEIFVKNKGVVLHSKIDEQWIITISRDLYQEKIPLVYIDGKVQQTVSINLLSFTLVDVDYPAMYLLSGILMNENVNLYTSDSTHEIKSVCTKGNFSRMKLVSKEGTGYGPSYNCNCNPDKLKPFDEFDYPDCKHNSTFFNLNLVEFDFYLFKQASWETITYKESGDLLLISTLDSLHFTILTVIQIVMIFGVYVKIDKLIFVEGDLHFEMGASIDSIEYTNQNLVETTLFCVKREFYTKNNSFVQRGNHVFYIQNTCNKVPCPGDDCIEVNGCYYYLNYKCDRVILCPNGMFFDESCKNCTTNDPNCGYCNGYDCVGCNDGFDFEDGKCTICPVNCRKCSDNLCIECDKGFYYEKGHCIECSMGCNVCDKNSCKECKKDLYLNNGICIDCQTFSSNCIECDDRQCKTCQVGYFLNQTGICQICDNIYPNCNLCNETECFECNEYSFFMVELVLTVLKIFHLVPLVTQNIVLHVITVISLKKLIALNV